jgi:hypothetical protein
MINDGAKNVQWWEFSAPVIDWQASMLGYTLWLFRMLLIIEPNVGDCQPVSQAGLRRFD